MRIEDKPITLKKKPREGKRGSKGEGGGDLIRKEAALGKEK